MSRDGSSARHGPAHGRSGWRSAAVYIIWSTTYLAIARRERDAPAAPRRRRSGSWSPGACCTRSRSVRGDRAGDRPGPRQWRAAAIVGMLLMFCGNGGVVVGGTHDPDGRRGTRDRHRPAVDRADRPARLPPSAAAGGRWSRPRPGVRRAPRSWSAVRSRDTSTPPAVLLVVGAAHLLGDGFPVPAPRAAPPAPVRRRGHADARRGGVASSWSASLTRRAGPDPPLVVLARIAARPRGTSSCSARGSGSRRTCGSCGTPDVTRLDVRLRHPGRRGAAGHHLPERDDHGRGPWSRAP